MSKYDKAGLAMIPSGYKDSKVYSLIPNSSNGDFDFTRGSTATRINKDGLIDTVASGVPRLEYPLIDGVVKDTPSLLLEPSRLNRVTYSQEFDDASWTKTDCTITANDSISPDGSQNADELTEDTANSTHRVSKSIIVSGSGVEYTQSVFAKSGNGTRFLRMFRASGTYNDAIFDLNNGIVVYTAGSNFISASIEKYPNGWYRCIITFTTQFANILSYFGLHNGSTDSYTGDGTSSIYIYGAQLEEGSYPTSYIPTSGSSVTRAAETCNGAGTSAEFNDSEGVLFAEISALADDGAESAIAIGNGTYDERVIVYTFNNYIYAFVFAGGVNVFSLGTTEYNVKEANKIALKYKSGDYSIYINGIEKNSNTTTTTPSGIDRLNFNDSVSGLHFYGNTKQLITFKEALTDSELEDLTSWDSFNEMATAQEYSIK